VSAVGTTPTTILVCPGSYPEQVTISKKITLKGVSFNGQGAAIITSPSGGLVQNAISVSGGGIEAQIFVENITGVIVEGLTTDASNANLDSLGCNGDPVGIFFQNASGTISHNSVLNDILSPSLTGCQGGLGIYVESGNSGTSLVSITDNNVENYQKNGITGNGTGTDVTITGNTAVGQGPWNGAAQNSIQIAFGANGSIKSNTVGSDVWAPDVFGDTGDAAAGILVYGSKGVTISSNNVSNTQFGISVNSENPGDGDGATVSHNVVATTHLYDGIDLCSNGNTASNNTIYGADESGIHLDDTCTGASTGNTVSANKINSSCAGVLSGPGASGTISGNVFYNTVTQQLTGVDTCTPPPSNGASKPAAKSRQRVRPAKP